LTVYCSPCATGAGGFARADHVEVARRLLAAGSPRTWQPLQGAPSPEGTLERLADLVAAAVKAPS